MEGTGALKGLYVYTEKGIRIKKSEVHKLVTAVKKKLNKVVYSLEISFVGSKTIHKINKLHLGHNYVTDVISFDYSNESNSFDGEIFICVEKAAENSKRFKVSLDDELKRLVIHGLLHFSGFDDRTKVQRSKMKKEEDEVLKNCRKIKIQ